MNGFTPDAPKRAAEHVPFYEDARAEHGWQGQGTTKSLETLKSELSVAISRLGGMVTGFQSGSWGTGKEKRVGFRIAFTIEGDSGQLQPGQLDIAALPVRPPTTRSRTPIEKRQEQSLRMALYMTRNAFEGMWFLRQLAPGFVPMLPWLLVKGGHTLTELYANPGNFSHLLPAGDADFVEGEYT